MKIVIPIMFIFLLSITVSASDIDWQVVSGGATDGASASYQLQGTTGQTAAGPGTSASYDVNQGYWQDFEEGGSPTCCIPPLRGNVNYDPGDAINIVDLTYLVAYLFSGGAPPPCLEEGNVNGDPGEAINIVDLTYLVAYLFSGGAPPPSCP